MNSTIYTDEWADAVFAAWEIVTNAEVEVFVPGEKTYDPDTGKHVSGSDDVKWRGAGRVYPVRSGERNLVEGDDSLVQTFRIQIPRNSVDLDDTMEIRVVDGGLNPFLKDYKFYIEYYFNQSAAFEQTIYATVNTGRARR